MKDKVSRIGTVSRETGRLQEHKAYEKLIQAIKIYKSGNIIH